MLYFIIYILTLITLIIMQCTNQISWFEFEVAIFLLYLMYIISDIRDRMFDIIDNKED